MRTRAASGDDTFAMGFGRRRGLRLGKTSWNVFTAAAAVFPLPRALGPEGLAATIYIQDGPLFEASLRVFRPRCEVYHREVRGVGPPGDWMN